MVDIAQKNSPVTVTKERKGHPFLFLFALALVFAVCVHFWNDWQAKSEARRLAEIVQSEEIAELIAGEGYNKKAFSAELENLKYSYTKKRTIDENMQTVMQEFANIPDFLLGAYFGNHDHAKSNRLRILQLFLLETQNRDVL